MRRKKKCSILARTHPAREGVRKVRRLDWEAARTEAFIQLDSKRVQGTNSFCMCQSQTQLYVDEACNQTKRLFDFEIVSQMSVHRLSRGSTANTSSTQAHTPRGAAQKPRWPGSSPHHFEGPRPALAPQAPDSTAAFINSPALKCLEGCFI